MDSETAQLVAAVVGGAIGIAGAIVGSVLTNRHALRMDRMRRREEILADVSVALEEAENKPETDAPLYELGRLTHLGFHVLSRDVRSKVNTFVKASRRWKRAHVEANRQEQRRDAHGREPDDQWRKALDALRDADRDLTEARSAVLEAMKDELGRTK